MSKKTIFDDVFRTICQKMPYLLIPLINEVFQTEYTGSSEIIQLRNEHMTLKGKLVTDSLLLVDDHLYHIECQSSGDSTMSIRMLEYDFSIAFESMLLAGTPYRLEFPQSCVVYLRNGSGKSGIQPVDVVFPDGTEAKHSIKIINVQDYTLDDIFQKNLLMFLPYYILRYEKKMPKSSVKDKEEADRLIKEYRNICKKLEKASASETKENYYADLISLIREISDYVVKNKKIRERIGDALMGGKVLTLWSEQLLAQGRSEGWNEGRNEGWNEGRSEGWNEGHSEGCTKGRTLIIFEMVRDGDISLQKGAKRLGITVESLRKDMALAGYSCPVE